MLVIRFDQEVEKKSQKSTAATSKTGGSSYDGENPAPSVFHVYVDTEKGSEFKDGSQPDKPFVGGDNPKCVIPDAGDDARAFKNSANETAAEASRQQAAGKHDDFSESLVVFQMGVDNDVESDVESFTDCEFDDGVSLADLEVIEPCVPFCSPAKNSPYFTEKGTLVTVAVMSNCRQNNTDELAFPLADVFAEGFAWLQKENKK